jgi:hypothetical protein
MLGLMQVIWKIRTSHAIGGEPKEKNILGWRYISYSLPDTESKSRITKISNIPSGAYEKEVPLSIGDSL